MIFKYCSVRESLCIPSQSVKLSHEIGLAAVVDACSLHHDVGSPRRPPPAGPPTLQGAVVGIDTGINMVRDGPRFLRPPHGSGRGRGRRRRGVVGVVGFVRCPGRVRRRREHLHAGRGRRLGLDLLGVRVAVRAVRHHPRVYGVIVDVASIIGVDFAPGLPEGIAYLSFSQNLFSPHCTLLPVLR
jgi:hypothetical protein